MAVQVFDEFLLQKLVKKGVIKEDDVAVLNEEAANSNKPVSQLVITRQLINEHELVSLLSKEFGCPPVNPNLFIISDDIISKIPSGFAFKNRVVPISQHENVLTIAMENPSDLDLVDDLKAVTGMRVRPAVALTHELLPAPHPPEEALIKRFLRRIAK